MTTAPLPKDGEAGAVARFSLPSVPTSSSSTAPSEWHLVGRVSVDTGQLVIVDPMLLDGWQPDDLAEVEPVRGRYPLSYSGASSASMSAARAGALGAEGVDVDLAVAVSTGAGDGSYPVWVRYGDDGLVDELRVDFTGEDSHPLGLSFPDTSRGSETPWNRERFLGDMRDWVLCSGTVDTDSTDDEVDRFLDTLPPGELQAWADYWVQAFAVEDSLCTASDFTVDTLTRIDLDVWSAELRRWWLALDVLESGIRTARENANARHDSPSTWEAAALVARNYHDQAIPVMQAALLLLGCPRAGGMEPVDGLVARVTSWGKP